ncbi:hypothetical protein Cni_G25806 [Canna indica]|uniref:Flavin-containing monooxygenase n=1 Tax=Canna indica TaxID=4628 RepID=A0AAQ3L0P2_9LILI|nr:hypothetical protein Cni_G25806 [Canna indica]
MSESTIFPPKDDSQQPKFCGAPIIVGAGPSGLAVAASLRRFLVPSVILERSDGIAGLWRHRTYDRLNLHLPKPFCELPHLPFPADFPTYPSKDHFLEYLHAYADRFSLRPLFGCTVVDARFDPAASLWRVTAIRRRNLPDDAPVRKVSPSSSSDSLTESSHSPSSSSSSSETLRELELAEFASPWLVVATGENAEPVVPEFKGLEAFKGSLLHSSEYKSGVEFTGKKVLVVGCGNSGMEICVDLCEHGAMPFMSVRSGVHILPREMLGSSTFGVAMKLLKWLPTRLVDRFLLIMAKMIIGDTEKYGLRRPKMGPLELKNTTGKTPVLDVGALSLTKAGRIKIVPDVKSLTSNGAIFIDGEEMGFDAVVFATGYKTNESDDVFTAEGKAKGTVTTNGCKGENGIYFVGFTGKGLLGTSADAIRTALHISETWASKALKKQGSEPPPTSSK